MVDVYGFRITNLTRYIAHCMCFTALIYKTLYTLKQFYFTLWVFFILHFDWKSQETDPKQHAWATSAPSTAKCARTPKNCYESALKLYRWPHELPTGYRWQHLINQSITGPIDNVCQYLASPPRSAYQPQGIVTPGDTRKDYIDAIQKAERGNLAPLIQFSRT